VATSPEICELEGKFEVGLTLPRRVALAWTASPAPVGLDIPEALISVGDGCVRCANLHTIQNVEELHAHFHVYTPPRKESFRYCKVFV